MNPGNALAGAVAAADAKSQQIAQGTQQAQRAAARAWLAARPPRERRLLAAGAAIAAIAIVSALLLAPLRAIPAQEARLAALRADHAALQALLAEALRLRARAPVPDSAPADLAATLQRSLAGAAIDARVEAAGPRQATVAGSAAGRQWLEWLAAAPRQARLRVLEAELVAGGSGLVAARIVVEARP